MEPLSLSHVDGLWPFADPNILRMNFSWAVCESYKQFRGIIQRHIEGADRDAYAMVLTETGQPVGSSSYLDIRPEHKAVEIGSTWIAASHQRTFVNPESKYLMLKHAFETLGCVRVQFKTDERNVQSRAAMVKLGCKWEGVLRKHIICPDGYIRNTVYYSILADEWPEVRDSLVDRLGYDPGSHN